MILSVTGYGNSISKRGNCLVVKNDIEEKVISIDAVSALIISTACKLTTDVLELCTINDVDLVFLDKYGNPYCEIQPFSGGCAPIIKRKQLLLQNNSQGVHLIKQFLGSKISNRIHHLRQLAKNRPKHKSEIFQTIDGMNTQRQNILSCEGESILVIRASLQGYEGSAGKLYFEQIATLLPEKYKFKTRNFHPAEDMYNCLLNYGYGVLYNTIKQNCYAARLDPYIVIMHADNYNKPTLVYDIVEAYRYISEKIAFRLCSKKIVVLEEHFAVEDGSVHLITAGKKILMAELYLDMRKIVVHQKKRITLEQKIQEEVKGIAKFINEV